MKKYSVETVVGIFVVIGLICVAYMTIKLGKVSLLGDNYYSLYANFSSVSGLRVGNPIEIDGIEVGRVENLVFDQEKQAAVAELKIGRTSRYTMTPVRQLKLPDLSETSSSISMASSSNVWHFSGLAYGDGYDEAAAATVRNQAERNYQNSVTAAQKFVQATAPTPPAAPTISMFCRGSRGEPAKRTSAMTSCRASSRRTTPSRCRSWWR